MSDEFTDDEQEGSEISIAPNDLRNLRQKAKDYDAAQAKLAEYERKFAFTEAKLDLSDKRTQYFVKGYEGEMTPEAIRAAAEEAGFLQSSPPPAPPSVPPDELSGHQRIGAAAAGADADSSFDLDAALAGAQSSEEVMAIMGKQGFPTSYNRRDYQ